MMTKPPAEKREARSRANKEYYERNRETLRANNRRNSRAAYARRKTFLNDLKRERACARCGFDDPRALQFHHRDPSEKTFTISRDGWKKSVDDLSAELDKCDLLCANCHQIEHAGALWDTP